MASLLNAWIGEYRVTGMIGAGGMGEVYRAVHTHLGRVIAIKVLSPGLADTAALKRFYSEAGIQASLRHPGVAEYFGFYEYDGRPCILMELVQGETLGEILTRRGALPSAEAVPLLREIASVVAAFHAQGIVHRDLKASNIKLTPEGRVKILDFGIAQHARSERLTRAGAVAGTPATLAPEQLRGDPLTPATDVWQLGILFYEMLAARLPFEAGTSQEVFARILYAPCPEVTQWQPGIPAPVARIATRCLEKDPHRRYASAAELHQALSDLDAPRHQRRPLLAGALAAALVLGGLTLFVHRHPPEPTPAAGAAQPPAADLKSITVDTMDGAAQVYRDGALVGTTPFEVQARPGDTIRLVLKRDGFRDLPVQFEPTERRSYTYNLQTLASPSN